MLAGSAPRADRRAGAGHSRTPPAAGGMTAAGWSSDAPRKIALGYLLAPAHALASGAPRHCQAIAARNRVLAAIVAARPRGLWNFIRFRRVADIGVGRGPYPLDSTGWHLRPAERVRRRCTRITVIACRG